MSDLIPVTDAKALLQQNSNKRQERLEIKIIGDMSQMEDREFRSKHYGRFYFADTEETHKEFTGVILYTTEGYGYYDSANKVAHFTIEVPKFHKGKFCLIQSAGSLELEKIGERSEISSYIKDTYGKGSGYKQTHYILCEDGLIRTMKLGSFANGFIFDNLKDLPDENYKCKLNFFTKEEKNEAGKEINVVNYKYLEESDHEQEALSLVSQIIGNSTALFQSLVKEDEQPEPPGDIPTIKYESDVQPKDLPF